MVKNTKGVGRPPETDAAGKPVDKTQITLLVPTFLLGFLRKNKINRSQLFTRVITMLYLGEICPKCYGDDINKTYIGTMCRKCSTDARTFFFIWNDCPSCNKQYARNNMGNYQWDDNNKPIYGCYSCMGEPETDQEKKERLEQEAKDKIEAQEREEQDKILLANLEKEAKK